ncbi:Uncharacterized protein DAT39_011498, partial [Clarias magur]
RFLWERWRLHHSAGLMRRLRRCTNAGGSSETMLWRYSSLMAELCFWHLITQ